MADFGMDLSLLPAEARAKLKPLTEDGGVSRRRDCHFADALSPSLLIHLLKGEGGAAE